MGLTEKRKLFFDLRKTCEILVKNHAFKDYPERGFSKAEIIHLVRKGTGNFRDNNSAEAIEGSYLFFVQDELERECKLVILIEEVEVEGESGPEKKMIIVCSAYRDVKGGA